MLQPCAEGVDELGGGRMVALMTLPNDGVFTTVALLCIVITMATVAVLGGEQGKARNYRRQSGTIRTQ